jgi:hypothetical protein
MRAALIIIAIMLAASMAYAAEPTSLSMSQAEKNWWIAKLKAPALTTVTKELTTVKLTVKTRDGKSLTFLLPAIKIGAQGKSYYMLSKEVLKYPTNPTGGTT